MHAAIFTLNDGRAMYASGAWDGFWEQGGWGRQPMREFELHFADGAVTGRGVDVVGLFRFTGTYDTTTGRVELVKQFIGKHKVFYRGEPDGEGCIIGTWWLRIEYGTAAFEDRGPLLLRPVLARPTGDEGIQVIRPG